MTETERAKQLATAHWGYVAGVIRVHGADEQTIKECGHHFTTAFEHAYGHALEDERNGMFRPRIGEPLTTGEIDAITHPKISDQQYPKVG